MNIEPAILLAWGTAAGGIIAAILAIVGKRSEAKQTRETIREESDSKINTLKAAGDVDALKERVSVESELSRRQSELVNTMLLKFQQDVDQMRRNLETANTRLTEAHIRENESAARILILTQQHERAVAELLVVKLEHEALKVSCADVKQSLRECADRITENETLLRKLETNTFDIERGEN